MSSPTPHPRVDNTGLPDAPLDQPVQELTINEFTARYRPSPSESVDAWTDRFDDYAEGDTSSLRALLGDIHRHGFRTPVTVAHGTVTSGHALVMAAWLLDMPVPFQDRTSGLAHHAA